jgi:hypothetical protein
MKRIKGKSISKRFYSVFNRRFGVRMEVFASVLGVIASILSLTTFIFGNKNLYDLFSPINPVYLSVIAILASAILGLGVLLITTKEVIRRQAVSMANKLHTLVKNEEYLLITINSDLDILINEELGQ